MSLTFLSAAKWHNEPEDWNFTEEALTFKTAPKSDFWQSTYYGFTPDSGHFLGGELDGDFCATVEFSGDYETLYDQIGLMLRIDPLHWLKAGVEYTDGCPNFSTVVTRTLSDWSVIPFDRLDGPQAVRLTRKGNAILTHFRTPSNQWQLMRLANFKAPETVLVGPVACSPLREEGERAFCARIHAFTIGPVPDDPLHGMVD